MIRSAVPGHAHTWAGGESKPKLADLRPFGIQLAFLEVIALCIRGAALSFSPRRARRGTAAGPGISIAR